MADTMVVPGVDGLFGAGMGGGGLIGGLILGSLLRNNGNLFGNGWNDGAYGPRPFGPGYGDPLASGLATTAGVNSAINQSQIETQLADIKAAIPYNEAQVQLALANTQTALTDQINRSSAESQSRDAATQAGIQAGFTALNTNLLGEIGDLENHIARTEVEAAKNTYALEKSISGSQYALAQAITADGDRTRSLITAQYEATLNRQLSEANNALAELRARQHLDTATRSIEVNTTNNINQMQQQTQQQQQLQYLAGIVSNLANDLQYIRATNQAINIGSGTLRANPTNTNVMA